MGIFRILPVNVEQTVNLRIQKPEILAEFYPGDHIVLYKHIHLRAAGVLSNGQYPRHIGKPYISLTFQQIAQKFQIILFIILRDKTPVKNRVPLVHYKNKSGSFLLIYHLQVIPDGSVNVKIDFRIFLNQICFYPVRNSVDVYIIRIALLRKPAEINIYYIITAQVFRIIIALRNFKRPENLLTIPRPAEKCRNHICHNAFAELPRAGKTEIFFPARHSHVYDFIKHIRFVDKKPVSGNISVFLKRRYTV